MFAILLPHEKSSIHLKDYQIWKELDLRLENMQTIDEYNFSCNQEQENNCKQVLERLIALVRVLSIQNLALRGSNERLYSAGNGN